MFFSPPKKKVSETCELLFSTFFLFFPDRKMKRENRKGKKVETSVHPHPSPLGPQLDKPQRRPERHGRRRHLGEDRVGDAAAVERPDALLVRPAQRRRRRDVEVPRQRRHGEPGVEQVDADPAQAHLDHGHERVRHRLQLRAVGEVPEHALEAEGLGAEKVRRALREAGADAEGVYVCPGAVDAEAVGAEREDGGAAAAGRGPAVASAAAAAAGERVAVADGRGNAPHPLIGQGVEPSEDLLAELGLGAGLVEVFVAEGLFVFGRG